MTKFLKLTAVALAGIGLSGCQSTANVTPGPYATDPLCAEVLVGLHGRTELANQPRREVSSQSTAAFGDPAIELRCGVEVPGPSTEGCLAVNGVDWVGPRDPRNNDRRYITYGRSPAVEVFVPAGSAAPIEVILTELATVASKVPQTRACT